MRTISYTCDKCGKVMKSIGATKLNISLMRGTDSMEKKTYDFCSPCFVKIKKAWKEILSGAFSYDPPVKEPIAGTSPLTGIDTKDIPKTGVTVTTENKASPAKVQESVDPIKSMQAEDETPKKRGRKPKVETPKDWTGRTEIFYGPIRQKEKAYILKLYVEEGLCAEEIAEKIHRAVKGIKRAITQYQKSGELDRMKTEFAAKQAKEKASPTEPSDGAAAAPGHSHIGIRNCYIQPAQTETIDGIKYDVGGIMALYKAGWPASEIAKDKGYDEDIVRMILEGDINRQP